MTQTKHTPGPWTKERDVIMANDGLLSICEVHDHSDTSTYHTAEEAQANAHFIVTACNAHYQQSDALALAVITIKRLAKTQAQLDSVKGTLDVIEAAIAKAQGKEQGV